MLYADKEALKTDIAVQILRVREKELGYYVQNLNTVSTQATLLAGFTFTFLSNLDFVEPEEGYLSADALRKLGLDGVDETDAGALSWNWSVWLKQLLQVSFICVSYSCLFINLWCTHQCVVNSILGPGLALRGPSGSVHRAVSTLMKQCGFVFELFELGVLTFGLSLMLYGVIYFGVVAWFPATIISCLLARATYKSIQKVILQLWLDEKDVVSGSFLSDHRKQRSPAGCGSSAERPRRIRPNKIKELMSSGGRCTQAGEAIRRAWPWQRRAERAEAPTRPVHRASDGMAADDEALFLILNNQKIDDAAVKLQKNFRAIRARRHSAELRRQSEMINDELSSPFRTFTSPMAWAHERGGAQAQCRAETVRLGSSPPGSRKGPSDATCASAPQDPNGSLGSKSASPIKRCVQTAKGAVELTTACSKSTLRHLSHGKGSPRGADEAKKNAGLVLPSATQKSPPSSVQASSEWPSGLSSDDGNNSCWYSFSASSIEPKSLAASSTAARSTAAYKALRIPAATSPRSVLRHSQNAPQPQRQSQLQPQQPRLQQPLPPSREGGRAQPEPQPRSHPPQRIRASANLEDAEDCLSQLALFISTLFFPSTELNRPSTRRLEDASTNVSSTLAAASPPRRSACAPAATPTVTFAPRIVDASWRRRSRNALEAVDEDTRRNSASPPQRRMSLVGTFLHRVPL
uniref:Uncharacterized protein n=1 Tax=Chrysotila carterae TaxID=13221 RepID=A0A7S4B853_CHRCT